MFKKDIINQIENMSNEQLKLFECFLETLNYDNNLFKGGSNSFISSNDKMDLINIITEIVSINDNLINIDIDYLRYEYYKKIYYSYDFLNLFGINCYDYNKSKLDINKIISLIKENNLNIDII